jgi:hypothetical protein
MNSTIQCLSNAVPFKDHFVNDTYKPEINKYESGVYCFFLFRIVSVKC